VETHEIGSTTIAVMEGDITAMDVDVVVNAANADLVHGGGVAAAIADAGGPSITAESEAWVQEHGRVPFGGAAVTTAGEMPASFVVHVVGPVYEGGGRGEEERLRAAVLAALDAAHGLGGRTVAMPAISTGIYGYPRDEATGVIVSAAADWARSHPKTLKEIRLVAFDPDTATAFGLSLRTQGS
jgi:putative ATPase